MPSFVCQRCKQPLRIDDSLVDLDESSVDLLLAPLTSEEQSKRKTHSLHNDTHETFSTTTLDTSLASKKHILRPSQRPMPPVSDSFVMLSNSQVHLPIGSSLSPAASVRLLNQQNQIQRTSNEHARSTLSQTNGIDNTKDATRWKADSISKFPSDPAISNASPDRNNSLSHRLKVATRLFDVMSSKSSVDHPMCQECTDMMLESLERQLDDVGRERDCYLDFLKQVKQQGEKTEDTNTTITIPTMAEDEEQLTKQVDLLIKKEQEALSTLAQMKKEQQLLDKQYQDLQQEEKELEKEEQDFWDECNAYQIQYQHFQNERDAINLKYDHDARQLERLQKTVVYNDAFCIMQDGPFGTINGYRLGRLPSHPVEWNEINAAWGQALLLLYTVANKLKFQFQSYRLVPMGSFSKVEKVDGDVVVAYELYGSSDYGLNRMLFVNRRFDLAMVAMLNCLKQLSDYAEQKDRSIRLPYRINKEKIGELSIRLQFNQDELWTRALKYMLTNMKWILIFASRTSVVGDT
ncbi:autophagy protein Apg6-domain-containing protein [Halteromyces radiatus]|uniref:autophagy protein Apg6-domain-containing protein n=1 Tax=Halteromyces radiatus TaxID=101107 RepID=UPI00221F5757|nr:autophagy protein Apg6-domain-containing protein [Halteromyces radiatus]KAI8098620.1 autophagy protein Apg6-domain-containing protein [Halteromyces radiatus]